MKRPHFAEWRPHPWHGLEAGRELPLWVNAYIEITPFDLIKYEVDKASGYLRVDRPQRTSSQPPRRLQCNACTASSMRRAWWRPRSKITRGSFPGPDGHKAVTAVA